MAPSPHSASLIRPSCASRPKHASVKCRPESAVRCAKVRIASATVHSHLAATKYPVLSLDSGIFAERSTQPFDRRLDTDPITASNAIGVCVAMQSQTGGSRRLLTSKERYMTGLLALVAREESSARSRTGEQAKATSPSLLLLERLAANRSRGVRADEGSQLPRDGIVDTAASRSQRTVDGTAVVGESNALTQEPTVPSSPSAPIGCGTRPIEDNSLDTQSAANALSALREDSETQEVSRAPTATASTLSFGIPAATANEVNLWQDESTSFEAPSADGPQHLLEFEKSERPPPMADATDTGGSNGGPQPEMPTLGRSSGIASHNQLDWCDRGLMSEPAAREAHGPHSPSAAAEVHDARSPPTAPAGATGEAADQTSLRRRLRLQERELDYLRGRVRHLQSYDAQPSSSLTETETPVCDHSTVSDRQDGGLLSRRLVRWLEMTSNHAGASAPPALLLAGFELLHGILDSGAWEAREHNSARSQFSVGKILQKVLAMNHDGWPAHVQAQVHEKAFELARHICHQLSTLQSRASAAWLLACQHVLEILGSGRANEVINLLAQQVRVLMEKLGEQQPRTPVATGAGQATTCSQECCLNMQPCFSALARIIEERTASAHNSDSTARGTLLSDSRAPSWRHDLLRAFELSLSGQVVHSSPLVAHAVWHLNLLAGAADGSTSQRAVVESLALFRNS